MANCDKLFRMFDSESLVLTTDRKNKLKTSRRCLRKTIRKWFQDNKPNELGPKFSSQGSWCTHTLINPIPEHVGQVTIVKYDLDDGVYFVGDSNTEIATYHHWILSSVKNHTDETIDKDTCVRVVFSDGHNIDLPIYRKPGEIPELAHKRDGWMLSDPLEFVEWFNTKARNNQQLPRIVRYLKAWCNSCEHAGARMPSGLIMTILAANHIMPDGRDDVALKATLEVIQSELQLEFKCERPTTPVGEDLLAGYSQNQKDTFLEYLESLLRSAEHALNEPNQKTACFKWQKHFGDRFPCHRASDEVPEANKYYAAAVIKKNAGSGN